MVEPLDMINQEEEASLASKGGISLNTKVAITVALLATFMGVCKVKDDNLVQAMQQAQANKLDHWSWYQATKIRIDVDKSALAQLRLQQDVAILPGTKEAYRNAADQLTQAITKENQKKDDILKQANQDDKQYNDLNYHDDQFDLSDATLSIAISLLAITSLTQKKPLFWLALIAAFFGVLMGLAGLLGWNIHPDFLTQLLS